MSHPYQRKPRTSINSMLESPWLFLYYWSDRPQEASPSYQKGSLSAPAKLSLSKLCITAFGSLG